MIRQGRQSTKKQPFAAWTLSSEEEEMDMFQPSLSDELEPGTCFTTTTSAHQLTEKLCGRTLLNLILNLQNY